MLDRVYSFLKNHPVAIIARSPSQLAESRFMLLNFSIESADFRSAQMKILAICLAMAISSDHISLHPKGAKSDRNEPRRHETRFRDTGMN